MMNKRQIVVLVLGLVALVGSVAVLGLTVMRARNLAQPTVSLPKAFDEVKYDPKCLQEDSRCSGAKTDPFSVPWPARAWCHTDNCPASWPDKSNKPYCGVDYIEFCLNRGYCDTNADCTSWLGQTCDSTKHVCVVDQGGNPCWNPQPIAKNGTYDSATKTFHWTWDTTYSSTVSHASIYIWTCSNKADSCYVGTAGATGPGLTSATFSNLQDGTTYYWGVNPNSYSPPPGVTTPKCTLTFTFMATGSMTGTIQGYKRVGTDNNNPAVKDLAVSLDGGSPATTNPYFLKNVPAGKHTVSVTPPAGYSAGYTLCYNRIDCHTGTPIAGNSVEVNISPGGYADLWWHFTQSSTTCPSGQTMCSTTCVDLATSPTNCSACGLVCAGNQSCVNGVCTENTITCDAGQTLCGSSCVDIATDTNNCGSCGNVCTTRQSCVNALCASGGSGEVDACWGNSGSNGKCYDCDGNGVINVLDFSCFRIRYGSVVAP